MLALPPYLKLQLTLDTGKSLSKQTMQKYMTSFSRLFLSHHAFFEALLWSLKVAVISTFLMKALP